MFSLLSCERVTFDNDCMLEIQEFLTISNR
jgi:hypothetical protein